MKKILAFSGSMSSVSINHQLIEFMSGLIDKADVQVIRLTDFEAPLYSAEIESQEGIPDGVTKLKLEFDKADGFILSTPEFNSSIPGGLKNTMDWLSRTDGKIFQEKPVLLIAASPGGRGGSSVLNHLSSIIPFWGAKLVGPFSFPRFHQNLVDGEMNAELNASLEMHIGELIEAIE